jgi:uncharacterized FAD-dependent dehydrogenase
MIRLRQVKLPIDKDNLDNLKKECSKILKINSQDIEHLNIHKKSLDARKKPNLFFVYEVDIKTNKEKTILQKRKSKDILETPNNKYEFNITGTKKLNNRPIIVGAGPAGLFCGYMLAKYGYKPIIIERGEQVEKREKTVEKFWKNNKLNFESNVQFGEGGAGTFSDGKLVTQIKDIEGRGQQVMDIFIASGAPKEIKYLNKPHIGTDLLRNIIINLRNKIIEMGGEFHYNTKLTNIRIKDNKIEAIELNNDKWLKTDILVLTIGHSARDTFEMLYNNNIPMEAKPFAVGVRIQHPQKLINKSQYGEDSNQLLGSASYKLTHKCQNGRGVYSFCMCPGGYVVNSSSEQNELCINGMSNNKRNSPNANSAIIVTISPKDYGTATLDGIKFQRALETKAYVQGQGLIPTQLYKDYKNNISSNKFGNIEPVFKGNYTLTNLNDIFPDYINTSLKEAIEAFDNNIKGFASDDAIISAVESRTSSPVRILRNEFQESSIKGLYPGGEGAGYAGGITSAAIDGIKIAESIASIYTPLC